LIVLAGDKERGQINFPNYASQLQAIFERVFYDFQEVAAILFNVKKYSMKKSSHYNLNVSIIVNLITQTYFSIKRKSIYLIGYTEELKVIKILYKLAQSLLFAQ